MIGLTHARNFPWPDVRQGFTSRAGGVSVGSLASLNLSLRPGEAREALVENWHRVARALDGTLDASDVALMNQVHGAEVVEVHAGRGPLEPVADADGAYTTATGVILAVRAADCVPVLLAGPGIVGVAHVGWRGAVAGVAGAVVRAMKQAIGAPAAMFGSGSQPGTFAAAIGPCISGPSFEVGDEVVDGLRGAGVPEETFRHGVSGAGRTLVDLRKVVAYQLEQEGLTDVWIDRRCTFRTPELWSHRRDGAGSGRFAGVIVRMS